MGPAHNRLAIDGEHGHPVDGAPGTTLAKSTEGKEKGQKLLRAQLHGWPPEHWCRLTELVACTDWQVTAPLTACPACH